MTPDEALAVADREEDTSRDGDALEVLAAEVRLLREALHSTRADRMRVGDDFAAALERRLEAEIDRLRQIASDPLYRAALADRARLSAEKDELENEMKRVRVLNRAASKAVGPTLAKLARVEPLIAKWRERSAEEHDDVARNVERELADELEAALRGEP